VLVPGTGEEAEEWSRSRSLICSMGVVGLLAVRMLGDGSNLELWTAVHHDSINHFWRDGQASSSSVWILEFPTAAYCSLRPTVATCRQSDCLRKSLVFSSHSNTVHRKNPSLSASS
jgi:hypothetical protein